MNDQNIYPVFHFVLVNSSINILIVAKNENEAVDFMVNDINMNIDFDTPPKTSLLHRVSDISLMPYEVETF